MRLMVVNAPALAVAVAVFLLGGCTSGEQASAPAPNSGGGEGDACKAVSVSQTVRLSNVDPIPVVTVAPGTAIRVTADAPFGTVTAPEAATASILCRSSVDLQGQTASAVFVARTRGQSRVTATVTGLDGGLAIPVFGVQVVVR
jgi:hypothetical protein